MMTPRRSRGCGACIPELTTRRHSGLSQAPWTVVMLRQPKHPHFMGGVDVLSAVPYSIPGTSFRGLLSLLATQQKWCYHLHQVQNLIPHNYYILVQHIRWCTQQPVRGTHLHPYSN